MKKLMIGLTPSHNQETDEIRMGPTYLHAIAKAGAIPVLLPLEAAKEDLVQLVDTFDGFIFTGGPDIHPFYFGEETQGSCGNASEARDTLELALLPLVMAAGKPILGICRGLQLINVALGGTLYQDLPSQFKEDVPTAHTQPFAYTLPAHHVTVAEGTLLAGIAAASEISVNSIHHQAIKDLAPGLTASGYAPNGLIEAAEKSDYPYLLGVQWHPEYLRDKDACSARLFQSFLDHCAAARSVLQ
ncbi:MAG: gamma-glutamyl-gamma-aminobutyrate hydrolase family protein [Hungatella sp.]